jgi:hypothetical protein
VAAIYTTSDGGFTIQNLVDLVDELDEHVTVVAQKEGLVRSGHP